MHLRRLALSIVLLFAAESLPGTLQARVASIGTMPLETLIADDRIVLDVGDRLATSAGDLCTDTRASLGLTVHDLAQYGPAYRAGAATLFARADLPGVLAVAAGGAADRAGVHAGDAIAAIDGIPVAAADADDGLARVVAIDARLDAAAAAGPVSLALVRGGRGVTVTIRPVRSCAAVFQTRVAPDLNARTDGRRIEVTTGLVAFVRGRDELAAILAHELAHAILHHRERLNAAGVRRGLLQHFGRNARLTRATEVEADRLSVYLVDRGGYAPQAIVSVWQRLARTAGGSNFLGLATHPSDAQRLRIIAAEIDRLNRQKAAGLPVRPEQPAGGAAGATAPAQ